MAKTLVGSVAVNYTTFTFIFEKSLMAEMKTMLCCCLTFGIGQHRQDYYSRIQTIHYDSIRHDPFCRSKSHHILLPLKTSQTSSTVVVGTVFLLVLSEKEDY
jgi:hypothetical protein